MATEKASRYSTLLTDALEYKRDYAEQVEKVENIYNGDYNLFDEVGTQANEGEGFVKTHGLYTQVRKTVAMMAPQPYMEFITEASNKEQEPDVSSSEVAKSLLDYLFNVNGMREKVVDGLYDLALTNFMRFRVIFKEDTRIETIEEQVGSVTDGVPSDVLDVGDDKLPGQPSLEIINWRDFLIPRGYKSVDEAWTGGGWVARQWYPLNEWVKSNKTYKNNRDIKPDAKFRGQHVETNASSKTGDDVSPEEFKYNCLWEIFFGPTKKHPQGHYVIHSLLQNKTLYEFDGKCFKGLNIPIIELPMFRGRANKYWVTPLAYRSVNPLIEHEYFETRVLQKNAASKTLIAIRSDVAGDETKDMIANSDKPVWISTTDSLSDVKSGPPFVKEEIVLNVENDRLGSLVARARFENLWGFSTSDPRVQGDQIATELVLQNKIFLSEMNDLIVRVNRCVEQVANAMLTISKEKMSPAEMDRIVRQANTAWNDDNIVTLEGNYAVKVKSKQLYDMTEGERSKVLQMYFTTLASASSVPALAERIDVIEPLKAWSDELGMPTVKTFRESQKISQWWEISQMLIGNPIKASPDDDHIGHMNVIQEFVMQFDQTAQTSQNVSVDPKVLEIIQAHAQEHQQFVQMMQGGAQGMATNIVNDSRSAGAQTIRGQGQAGVIGERNQAGGM